MPHPVFLLLARFLCCRSFPRPGIQLDSQLYTISLSVPGPSALRVKERWLMRRLWWWFTCHSHGPSYWPPSRKMQPVPAFDNSSHGACGGQIRHYERGKTRQPKPANEWLDSPVSPSVSTSAWRISERETIPLTTSCSSTTTSLCTWKKNRRRYPCTFISITR